MNVWVVAARMCYGSDMAFAEESNLELHVARMYEGRQWRDVTVKEVTPWVDGQRQFEVYGVNPKYPSSRDSCTVQFQLIEVKS